MKISGDVGAVVTDANVTYIYGREVNDHGA